MKYNTNLRQIHESFQNSSKEELYVGTISRRNCLRIQISAETLFETQYLFFTPASEAVKVSRRWTFQTWGAGRGLSNISLATWNMSRILTTWSWGLRLSLLLSFCVSYFLIISKRWNSYETEKFKLWEEFYDCFSWLFKIFFSFFAPSKHFRCCSEPSGPREVAALGTPAEILFPEHPVSWPSTSEPASQQQWSNLVI